MPSSSSPPLGEPLSDTHPEIECRLIEAYRAMTPAQKWRILTQMRHLAIQAASTDIAARHPQASAEERRLRLASRFLEPELMQRAFGWDVNEQGY